MLAAKRRHKRRTRFASGCVACGFGSMLRALSEPFNVASLKAVCLWRNRLFFCVACFCRSRATSMTRRRRCRSLWAANSLDAPSSTNRASDCRKGACARALYAMRTRAHTSPVETAHGRELANSSTSHKVHCFKFMMRHSSRHNDELKFVHLISRACDSQRARNSLCAAHHTVSLMLELFVTRAHVDNANKDG